MTVDEALDFLADSLRSSREAKAFVEVIAAIKRVQELHIPFTAGYCQECAKDYPCPTIAALVGPS